MSKILGQYPDFDKKVITKTIRVITLFHVTPVANLFYVRGGVKVNPPSNFVILKDRDLKISGNVYF